MQYMTNMGTGNKMYLIAKGNRGVGIVDNKRYKDLMNRVLLPK